MGEKHTKKHTKTAKNKKENQPKRKTKNENMEKDTQFSTALGEWVSRGEEREREGTWGGHGPWKCKHGMLSSCREAGKRKQNF